MATITVDVDLDEFDTEDLIDELKSRGKEQGFSLESDFDPMTGRNSEQLLDAVYECRRTGNDARALELIDRLIYAALGRIV